MGNSRRPAILILVASVTVCACLSVLPNYARAADKDCEALMKQIDGLDGRVADASERLGEEEKMLEQAEAETKASHEESTHQKWIHTRDTLKETIEKNKSTIRKNESTIRLLLEKLCTCCSKDSEHVGKPPPTPTPSTTDKV